MSELTDEQQGTRQLEDLDVDVKRLRLNPGDIIVIKLGATFDGMQHESFREFVQEVTTVIQVKAPGHEVMFVGSGVDLMTMGPNELPPDAKSSEALVEHQA